MSGGKRTLLIQLLDRQTARGLPRSTKCRHGYGSVTGSVARAAVASASFWKKRLAGKVNTLVEAARSKRFACWLLRALGFVWRLGVFDVTQI
ncbi:hypothetical protein O3P69_003746 [Scylla paramamosain]|uniref:Uncharacterized protein n=1 Tax=Scylla paramamosain TaxID=85552 RepID=A0AAW0UH78_SCYPA